MDEGGGAAASGGRGGSAGWIALALFLGSLALYLPALDAGWSWCDDYTVVHNPMLDDEDALARIWSGGETEQYYPLSYSATWLLHRAGAHRPEHYRAANLLLHALGVVALWAVLRARGGPAPLFVAAVFAAHPLQVESVVWIYELRNVLSFALAMLAVGALERFGRRGSAVGALGASLAFAAALLAKSMVVVVPALLLVDRMLRRRGSGSPSGSDASRRWWWLWGVFAGLGLLSAGVTVVYELEVTRAGGVGHAPEGLAERGGLAARAWLFYVGRTFVPLGLTFHYPPFDLSSPGPWLGLWGGLAGVAGLVTGRWPRGRPALLTGVAFTLAVLPVLGFVDIYYFRYAHVANHWASYAVLVGAMAVAALGRGMVSHAGLRRALGVGGVLLLVGLTLRRLPSFEDEERTWRRVEQLHGATELSGLRLGLLAKGRGDREEAYAAFASAARLGSREGRINTANLLAELGLPELALREYRAAESEAPLDAGTRHGRAGAAVAAGRLRQALADYTVLLEGDPEDEIAAAAAEGLEQQLGRLDREIERLQRIVGQRPEDLSAWRRLAMVSASVGDEAAGGALEEWRRRAPADREAAELAARWFSANPPPDGASPALEALDLLRQDGELDPELLLLELQARSEHGPRDAARRVARRLEQWGRERGDLRLRIAARHLQP